MGMYHIDKSCDIPAGGQGLRAAPNSRVCRSALGIRHARRLHLRLRVSQDRTLLISCHLSAADAAPTRLQVLDVDAEGGQEGAARGVQIGGQAVERRCGRDAVGAVGERGSDHRRDLGLKRRA